MGHCLLFQSLHQDPFHPVHVDEIDSQGTLAGGVETLGRVAIAQPDQLMPLADLRPRMPVVEEPLGEFAYCRPVQGRAALDALRSLHGVGGKLGRIIIRVGGAATARLTLVDLDQLAPVVDAYQLPVQPDFHPLSRRTGR